MWHWWCWPVVRADQANSNVRVSQADIHSPDLSSGPFIGVMWTHYTQSRLQAPSRNLRAPRVAWHSECWPHSLTVTVCSVAEETFQVLVNHWVLTPTYWPTMAYKLVTKISSPQPVTGLGSAQVATIHDRVCPSWGHYLSSLCLDFLTVIVCGENTLKGLELPD